MDRVKECLKNCRLYKLNNRKGIKQLLKIPDNLNLNDIRGELSSYYNFFYLKKPDKIKSKMSKEEIRNKYLSIEENLEIYDERPADYTKDKYRMLINIREKWLKQTLKRINKLLSQSLIKKNKKNVEYPIPYLHSSLKKRSYNTNVKAHKNHKYILAIDLKAFYPSVSYEKIINFFRHDLKLEKDIAEIYTALCTCPLDDPQQGNIQYGIGQGLATSPVLAFLTNYRMFEYIYSIAQKSGIEMTVYVDDIVFSSSKPIEQTFINSLFGIVKKNNLKINKNKVKLYGPKQVKKITGLCIIKGGSIKVPNSKHFETKIQFEYLVNKILVISNIDDYLSFYNLFLKFKGNVQFIELVEDKIPKKYSDFIKEYKDYFLYGVPKIKKSKIYTKSNVSNDDYKSFVIMYERLKKKIDKVKNNKIIM